MTPDVVRLLCGPDGKALIEQAQDSLAGGADDLSTLTALRRTADADLAAAALLQAHLRARAVGKLGADAHSMVLLPDSLQQATRREVAAHRAATAYARGVRQVVDAGAGLGADSIAFARAGMDVIAIERDPVVAAALRANVTAVDLGDAVRVIEADALEVVPGLGREVTVFADPARRVGGRRIFDPEVADPPLSWLVALAEDDRDVCAKMSPSLAGRQVPGSWEAAWTSTATASGRSVVEASLWSPRLATTARRAAVLGNPAYELCGEPDPALPVGDVSTYIYEPDGAVNQAELVQHLVNATGGHLLSPGIGYLSADRLIGDLPARAYRVLQVISWSKRAVGAALGAYDASDLVVKKRGIDLDPQQVRRQWLPKLAGRSGEPLTVIVVRRARGAIAVLAAAQ